MLADRKYNTDKWLGCLAALVLLVGLIGLMAGCAYADPTTVPTTEPTTALVSETTTASTTAATTAATTATTPVPKAAPNVLPTAATGNGDLTVLAINVGRADAILIQAEGRSFLIDTGTKDSVPQLFRALNLRGVRTLDAVFLTHAHADHAGGLPSLAQGFPIGKLYSAKIAQPDKDGGNRAGGLAEALSLQHQLLKKGDTIPVADGMDFEVLAPLVYNDRDDNDNSLVLRLRAHGRTILLTGDMQFAEEETLLQDGAPLKADILKVANHGNPDATSDAFAAAVSPSHAIISTNTDDDPDSANPRVADALKNARILITQDYACGIQLTIKKDGAIQVASPSIPPRTDDIRIVEVNQEKQTVTIRNGGAAVDLSGCFLVSQQDSDVFVFPQGAVLKESQIATISGKPQAGGFHWRSDGKMWKGKKAGSFTLYDRHGNVLSEMNADA